MICTSIYVLSSCGCVRGDKPIFAHLHSTPKGCYELIDPAESAHVGVNHLCLFVSMTIIHEFDTIWQSNGLPLNMAHRSSGFTVPIKVVIFHSYVDQRVLHTRSLTSAIPTGSTLLRQHDETQALRTRHCFRGDESK